MTDQGGLRVLLVEPELETASRLQSLLVGGGEPRLDVAHVLDARDAERSGGDVDAVLVGPGALGSEQTKALCESFRDTAIVALGDGSAAFELGAEYVLLEEEWTPRIFERTLRHAVERRHFARELHHLIEERVAGEESMRNIVSSWADGVVVSSLEHRILYLNPAAERLLSDRAERLVGNGLPFPVDGTLEEVELSGRTVSLRSVPVEWEGRSALLVTLHDETERRAAERALRESEARIMQAQKMEAIGRLAGGVAHDFNNLLTAISGYSELLLGELPADGPSRPDLMEIRKAAERASALTRQLLAFSRRQVLQPVVLDLNRTVSDLQKLLRRVLGEDIELCCSLAHEAALVTADPGRIEQILLDLAVNAREAMPTGGKLVVETDVVTLEWSSDHGEFVVPPGTYVSLSMADTGIGMDRETARHVFEPFFTTKSEGTGLGLSTVYGTVKQSGGYVWVTSAPRSGTRFEIYLPATKDAPEAAEPGAGAPLRGRETILLAEDERPVRELARRLLEREGYRVLLASSGIEAVQVSSEHPGDIDLVLTDVIMPGMGGVDAADAIRALRPGVKLLFLSGYSDRIVARDGKLDSGFAYLSKPFSGAALVREVRKVLDSDQQRAATS